jgi:DNA repair protein RAD50
MMQKNGQLIEMKGRCSMGQKVLASIIIRMALAEAFSASTHILALDEPTTNLDRTHIENLSQSLNEIIEMDQNKKLQFIIISHDMEFLSLLKKHTNFYYEICRNDKNFSMIIKK